MDVATCTAAELEAAWEAHGSGLTDALLKQTRATLSTLCAAPKAFQPRDKNDTPWAKEDHIKGLVNAVKEYDTLDPIIVFPIAGQRIVVDGHCRLEAYRKVGRRGRVPIQYLRGSFADALLYSAEANAKDKLPLTKAEKLEAAWRLVLFDEGRERYTLKQIATAADVSKSTVGNMKQTLQEHPQGSDDDPRTSTWADVKRGQRGERSYDDAWEEKQVRELAQRLRRTFSTIPVKSPELFVQALEMAYPRAWDALLDAVAEEHMDEVRERAEEMAHDDF